MREELKRRTQMLGIDAIRLSDQLRSSPSVSVVTRQLIRAATSVGANYRSACRGRSRRDFIAKLSLVEEEADEVRYWLEILDHLGIGKKHELQQLHQEAGALVAIMVASKKTARRNLASQ